MDGKLLISGLFCRVSFVLSSSPHLFPLLPKYLLIGGHLILSVLCITVEALAYNTKTLQATVVIWKNKIEVSH